MLLLFLLIFIQLELAYVEKQAGAVSAGREETEKARELLDAYEGIWKDISCFPIPESTKNPEATVSFEDSWMYERSYGGSYGHEGTDIMPAIRERGFYPVVSMTDGIIEKIGWLPKGGYRIGIRSRNQVYFYYAHLSSYAEGLKAGDAVKAGELLGFMGDTGYSEVEGTTGNFPVHLHVGIYLKTEQISEISVNPYWFLKYLEGKRLKAAF